MTSFADLGLDPTVVTPELQSMGIDTDPYSSEELSSLMLVTNLFLKQAIFDSAENVEELVFDYAYQADRLSSMQATFNRLLDTIGVANAEATKLIDFLEGEDTYLDVSDASLIAIDYSWSYTDSSTSTTYTLEDFGTLQDFISAVDNNETIDYSDGSGSIAALEFAYNEGVAAGWFEGVVAYNGATASLSDLLSGGSYYLQVDLNDSDTDVDVYMDLDGFKQYLIARVLNEAGYIGDDVKLDPPFFASTALPSNLLSTAITTVEFFKLYFGRTTVAFDAAASSVSVTYNGAAAMREMGLTLESYFEKAVFPVPLKDTLDNLALDPNLYEDAATVEVFFTLSDEVDVIPLMDEDSDGNWMLALVGSYVASDLDTFLSTYGGSASASFDDLGLPITVEVDNDSWTNDLWDTELTALEEFLTVYEVKKDDHTNEYVVQELDSEYTVYLDADSLDDVLEDVGTELQSQSSTGELALVEASTALTEWSELHGGWDTVQKYITDALGRAVAMMK